MRAEPTGPDPVFLAVASPSGSSSSRLGLGHRNGEVTQTALRQLHIRAGVETFRSP